MPARRHIPVRHFGYTATPLVAILAGVVTLVVLSYTFFKTDFGPTRGNQTRNTATTNESVLTDTTDQLDQGTDANVNSATDNNLNSAADQADTTSLRTFTASNGASIEYPVGYVVQHQDADSIELANTQSCLEQSQVATPGVMPEGCNYPSFHVQQQKISVASAGVTRQAAEVGPLEGEKITDTGDQNIASYVYQAQKAGTWYIFSVYYSPVDGDGVDLVISKMAASLQLPSSR